jgi:hypothetical protein
MANFNVVIEPAALALAAITPTAGWGTPGAPIVSGSVSALEYRCRMKRAYGQLVALGYGRQVSETAQQWADRIYSGSRLAVIDPRWARSSPDYLFHQMATAFANGVTS